MNCFDAKGRDILTKSAIVHTVTYFIVGLIGLSILDYPRLFAGSPLMRPINDPIVTAGLLFQPIRGFLFGIIFSALRDPFVQRKNGWLLMWMTLMIVGIIGFEHTL